VLALPERGMQVREHAGAGRAGAFFPSILVAVVTRERKKAERMMC